MRFGRQTIRLLVEPAAIRAPGDTIYCYAATCSPCRARDALLAPLVVEFSSMLDESFHSTRQDSRVVDLVAPGAKTPRRPVHRRNASEPCGLRVLRKDVLRGVTSASCVGACPGGDVASTSGPPALARRRGTCNCSGGVVSGVLSSVLGTSRGRAHAAVPVATPSSIASDRASGASSALERRRCGVARRLGIVPSALRYAVTTRPRSAGARKEVV